jgi:hypothetical protein
MSNFCNVLIALQHLEDLKLKTVKRKKDLYIKGL